MSAPLEDLKERVIRLEAELHQIRGSQADIGDKLDRISAELTRYKGFMGGVAFLLTAVVSVVGLFKDYLLSHLQVK